MNNRDIREELNKANMKYWQLAESLGINDGNLSRKLRREITGEEKAAILSIIRNFKQHDSQAITEKR